MTDADRTDDLAARLAHARERALLDDLAAVRRANAALELRLDRLERQLGQLGRQHRALERRQRGDANRLQRGIAGKRLDKQLVSLLRAGRRAAGRLRRRFDRSHVHVLVVCPAYPGGPKQYGGEFVRARVRLYRAAGATVTVVVVPSGRTKRNRYEHEGVTVIRVDARRLADTIRAKAPDVVAVHHLTPEYWEQVRTTAGEYPTVVWVHGFEARDWRELAFNFTEAELASRREVLDELNASRRATLAAAFADERLRFVFVSHFMRGVAEGFVGRAPVHGRVIPNVIDGERFPYREKAPELRHHVLWVRTFSAHNYANDLSRDAVLELAAREGFDRYRFTVVGDGRDFEEITAPLRELPNVTVRRGFVNSEELAELHAAHGVMLVPSRWDSQGLTSGEAMSSGLVPVTSRVAAVPEFVPDDAGMVCPPDDAVALADAIERLAEDPQLFSRLSRRAAAQAQAQCGREATTDVELALLRAHAKGRA